MNYSYKNNLVIYVRHAESEANRLIHNREDQLKPLSKSQEAIMTSLHTDPNITLNGTHQAVSTANYLLDRIRMMGRTNVTVWISPFQRTLQTAKPFIDLCANHHHIDCEVCILPELQEYTTDKYTLSDKQKQSGLIVHESVNHFLDKVVEFSNILKNQLKTQESNNVLIVFGHSLFISSLMAYHVTHETFLNDLSGFHLPNCSISCEMYQFEKNRWHTFIVGSIAHIPEKFITGNHVPIGYLHN